MKCPVCDKENESMLCPVCGFDSSRDYGRYPTFGPLPRMGTDIISIASAIEHLYMLIEEWKERLHKQQALEKELQRKDIIINDLRKELRETRTELAAAQEEIEKMKNPPAQKDPYYTLSQKPLIEFIDEFLKY